MKDSDEKAKVLFVCSKCGQKFDSQLECENHLETHSATVNVRDLRLSCRIKHIPQWTWNMSKTYKALPTARPGKIIRTIGYDGKNAGYEWTCFSCPVKKIDAVKEDMLKMATEWSDSLQSSLTKVIEEQHDAQYNEILKGRLKVEYMGFGMRYVYLWNDKEQRHVIAKIKKTSDMLVTFMMPKCETNCDPNDEDSWKVHSQYETELAAIKYLRKTSRKATEDN